MKSRVKSGQYYSRSRSATATRIVKSEELEIDLTFDREKLQPHILRKMPVVKGGVWYASFYSARMITCTKSRSQDQHRR